MKSNDLYCKWLKRNVPRDKWFCMPSLDNGKITCFNCNWSEEIKTK